MPDSNEVLDAAKEVRDALKTKWDPLYSKATTNLKLGPTESEKRFKKKYKYAKIDKFEFDVELDETTADVSKYIVRYKVPDNDGTGGYSSYDITSETFTKNPEYRKDLFWKEFWEDTGTVQEFKKNEKGLGRDHKQGSWYGWRIYVSNRKSFHEWLGTLEITAPTEGTNANDYKENKYLASLYAAYITTYSCGVSTYHFKERNDVPRIITSLMKYHLYFHMTRFLKNPSLMDQYVTADITKIILANKPKKYIIEKDKLERTSEELGTWVAEEKRKGRKILNAKYAKNEAGSIVGIRYDLIVGTQIHDLKNDYKLFVAEKTNGITPTGVKLLQKTVQSFVYAILGAQVNARAPIVGGLQGAADTAQDEFKKIVKATIVKEDPAESLNNMRTAVINTKSRLNLAICPGVSLIPSNLIILKDVTIQGYNNGVKDVDTKTMVFGKNNQVNKDTIAVSKNSVDTTPTPTVRQTPQVNNPTTSRLQEETTKPKTQTTALAVRGPTAVAKYVPPHNKTIVYTSATMLTLGALVAKFLI